MSFQSLDDLVMQVRQVSRGLLRSLGFTLTVVGTVGVSIGAVTAIFSVIQAVLLSPLPYVNPGRIVMLWSAVPSTGIAKDWTSYPDIQDWARRSHSFVDIAPMLRVDTADLTAESPIERTRVSRTSSDFFTVLGVVPALGRSWSPKEEQLGGAVAVISDAFWTTHFAEARDVLGRTIEIDHKPATVVGVMPAGFDFPSPDTDMWIPLTFISNWPAFLVARQADAFNAVARLKSEVSLQQARQDMFSISEQLSREYPRFEAGKSISVVPLSEEVVNPGTRTALWTLFGAVFFLLLIACANVGSLLLARQNSRERDVAICVALGASRARLIRLQMLECLLLSLLSAAPGLVVAAIGIAMARAFGPRETRGMSHLHIDLPSLICCLIASLLAGVLFGLAPSWISAHRDLSLESRVGGRTVAGSRKTQRMNNFFMSLQVAFAMILVSGSGLMIRSFLRMKGVNLGYQPHGLLFIHIEVPSEGKSARYCEELLVRISAVPGVKSAGAIDSQFSDYIPDDVVELDGYSEPLGKDGTPVATSHLISSSYLQTAGAPLLRGRYFTAEDREGSVLVAIVNRSMARRLWHTDEPTGKRFRYGVPGESPSAWRTVIGVVGDILPNGPESRSLPQFYLPLDQGPEAKSMDIIVRGKGDLPLLANDVRSALLGSSLMMRKSGVSTVDSQLERLGSRRRFHTWLLTVFSAISLFLASIGTYGLSSYSVTERIREIGIRMALGASRADVLRLMLLRAIRNTGVGLTMGTIAALVFSRAASNLLFEVSWADGTTVCLASGLLLFSALIAAYIPATRATKVDPRIALSSE